MNSPNVKLYDGTVLLIATGVVVEVDGRYEGTMDCRDIPDAILAVFLEFEEIVSDQVFSFLDEIERKIADLGLQGEIEEGELHSLVQFQPNPSSGEVAFRFAPVSALRV